MMTARLRKSFKYPEESDSEGPPEGIDEQEQEELIAQLQTQDESTSEFYRRIFLAAPVLCCLSYPLLAPPAFEVTTTVLCISSLLFSAYTLWTMPLTAKQPILLSGPLERYLPILNSVLATILATSSLISRGQKAVMNGDFLLSMLPILVCMLVWGLKSELRNVDMNELSKLKYDYKGA